MHSKNIISALVVTAVLSLFLVSCNMKTKTIEPYAIRIDSIYAPDTVAIRTLFEIRLFGYIGPSKCYSFDKAYYNIESQNDIYVEAWGKYTYEGTPCVSELVFMDQVLSVVITTPGVYTIKGYQSGYSYVEKKLVVM